MKYLLLLAASLGALCAQDIVGTWQGAVTLLSGQDARMVIKIASDSGNLNATLYPNIDANPRPIPATSQRCKGPLCRSSS